MRPSSVGEEELQLQLALAMSKEEHDEELRRKKAEDLKLAMALEESKKDATAQGGFEVGTACELIGGCIEWDIFVGWFENETS